MPRTMSDLQAMDEIADWVEVNDPVLVDVPNWVWALMSLLDDLIYETGRNG